MLSTVNPRWISSMLQLRLEQLTLCFRRDRLVVCTESLKRARSTLMTKSAICFFPFEQSLQELSESIVTLHRKYRTSNSCQSHVQLIVWLSRDSIRRSRTQTSINGRTYFSRVGKALQKALFIISDNVLGLCHYVCVAPCSEILRTFRREMWYVRRRCR